MEKIASFTIDHIRLQPGIYVSRKDHIGAEVITTFDLRMTSPNEEPVMNTAELHTIEHLGATFLRNHKEFCDRTIILDRWAAGRAFICFLQEIMIPAASFRSSPKCLSLSGILREMCPVRPQKTAAIISI